MTAVQHQAHSDGAGQVVWPNGLVVAAAEPRTPRQLRPRRRLRLLPNAWPIKALLLLFPLWWALGLAAFAFPLFAVPMLIHLWRRRGRLVLGPGFVFWALFLALNLVSIVMLPVAAPETVAGSTNGRILTLFNTLAVYGSATVTLIYVANLRERELPQARLVQMLGVLFLVTVAGGLLGVLAPSLEFTAPLELLLPESVRSDLYVQALVHPSTAQIQDVLGYEAPRPAAPFGYTNFWGNNLSILLVWFVLWTWRMRSPTARVVMVAVLVIALVPVVQSLNRALWFGIAVSVLYLGAQMASRGRVSAVFGMVGVALVALAAFLLSPLQDTVSERIDNPTSNSLRGFLAEAAVDGAAKSPVIGWGGPRNTLGSAQSIAVGATSECPQCGNFAIGSTGQFWYVLFSQGFLGAVLFVVFFARTAWRYVRQRDPVSQAAGLVLLLAPMYALFYSSLPAALTLTFISLGVAWRQDRLRPSSLRPTEAPPASSLTMQGNDVRRR